MFSGIISGVFSVIAPMAQAQIIPDDTLGPNASWVPPGAQTPIPPNFVLIQGGANPDGGGNLFHSFREFQVHTGQAVYFDNSTDFDNILARITGDIDSQIDGILGVQGGDANLFLLNPNGIHFGPDASLDLGGSFFATTADAIQLGNGGLFSATNPEDSILLTIDPSGFLINQPRLAPIPITNMGFLMAYENLVLVADELQFLGGELVVQGGRSR
jgi:filamentous hemagglutinin family protein